MMLAAELTLANVDVAILERRPDRAIESSRGGGLHARTIEVLDQRGVADRFIEAGRPMQVAGFGYMTLDISDFPSRHPYGLALWQKQFEEILGGWIDELAVPVERGCEVTGFAQDDDGVDVHTAGGRAFRAQYLVGCDGGRSVVRRAAGIDFPGWDASMSSIIAEVEMTEEPDVGMRRDEKGIHAMGLLEDGRVRVVVRDEQVTTTEATLEDLRDAIIAAWGRDFGPKNPTWISRFSDTTRQAASYRAGRVLLAGDAANVHSPVGGQGLNTGIQDAVNLGWKLAQVVRGESGSSLLDSYHDERHPVAARVLRTTMAQTALMRANDRTDALRDKIGELLALDDARKLLGGEMSGLDIHYDLGEGHPLVGRRMPDLEVETADGPVRVYTLLHEARPALLNFGHGGAVAAGRWADRVRLVDAGYAGEWELPVLGAVSAPSAVLVRPDGYVAWVGEGSDTGLSDALARWFG